MHRRPLSPLLLFLPLLLIACGPAATAVQPPPPLNTETTTAIPRPMLPSADSDQVAATEPPIPTPSATPAANQREPIILPISVYIIDETSGALSSGRTAVELESIFAQANEIWSPAAISIEIQMVDRIILPTDVVRAIATGDYEPFFDEVERSFSIPNPSLLNAFYAREIGGANGLVPFNTRLFFVTDTPTVHHERVTSHEIGHILGLHHTLLDEDRLMFPGTNGTNLTEEEIVVARYVARGLLEGVR